jgi:hypothetical protein
MNDGFAVGAALRLLFTVRGVISDSTKSVGL